MADRALHGRSVDATHGHLEARLLDLTARLTALGVNDGDVRRALVDVLDDARDLHDWALDGVDAARQLAEARMQVADLERAVDVVADQRAHLVRHA